VPAFPRSTSLRFESGHGEQRRPRRGPFTRPVLREWPSVTTAVGVQNCRAMLTGQHDLSGSDLPRSRRPPTTPPFFVCLSRADPPRQLRGCLCGGDLLEDRDRIHVNMVQNVVASGHRAKLMPFQVDRRRTAPSARGAGGPPRPALDGDRAARSIEGCDRVRMSAGNRNDPHRRRAGGARQRKRILRLSRPPVFRPVIDRFVGASASIRNASGGRAGSPGGSRPRPACSRSSQRGFSP